MCSEIQVYIPNSPSLPSAWFHPGASLSLSLCGWGHNARSAWQKSTTCQKKHHSLGVPQNLYPEKIENCQNKKTNHYITTASNFGGSASCFSATPSFSKTPSSLRMLRPWTAVSNQFRAFSFRSSMSRVCLDMFLIQVDKQGSIGNVGATRVLFYAQKQITIGCVSEFSRSFSEFPGCLGNLSGQKTQYVKTCQDVLLGCAWKAVTNSWHPVTNFSY